jgi:Ca2+-binding RTX toxin-like protein
MRGGADDDLLIGGRSVDTLHGGGGDDTFAWTGEKNQDVSVGVDVVLDFNQGVDQVQLDMVSSFDSDGTAEDGEVAVQNGDEMIVNPVTGSSFVVDFNGVTLVSGDFNFV